MRAVRFFPVLCAGLVAVGCGARARPDLPSVPVSLPVADFSTGSGQPLVLREDPAAGAVLAAEAAFALGEAEFQAGRVVTAREHFDRAVDALLALPAGARAETSTAAVFDRLLDRISALELLALREGDGRTETDSEPAAIDVLLDDAVFERPAPAATTAETVRADLARTPVGIDIPANDRVLSFVELFQTRRSEFIVDALERGRRYLPMIRQVFAEEAVPEELVYVPIVESAFKPNALSRVSARGLWQFMPATGLEYGLRQTWFVDERSDPEKATRAAARYLKALHRMFDGDWNMALASYNAGPGRVQRAAQRAGIDDYWRLASSARFLPRDTRDYVPMIMAAILIARNPSLYGFNVGAGVPMAFERVEVPGAIDLKIVAEWCGVTADELRALNPELRRTTTPVGVHSLKVPIGTASTVQRELASGADLIVQFAFHSVKRGETLAAIARRYHVSTEELRAANDLPARARLRVRQELMIPQRSAQALPSPVARLASSAPAAASKTVASSMPRPTTYRVQRGDTLYAIARRFDTTVDAIKRLNRLRSNTINIGDRLTVQ